MSEKRRDIRVEKRLEATYSCNSPPIKATAEDLSESGMFLDTQHRLGVGDVLDFELFVADETPEMPIRGKGEVIWSQPMVGVGVRFLNLDDATRERIRFFVAAVYFSAE